MTNHEIAVLQAELRILYGIADLARTFAYLDRQLMKGADVFKERDAAKQDLHDLFSDAPYAPIVDGASCCVRRDIKYEYVHDARSMRAT